MEPELKLPALFGSGSKIIWCIENWKPLYNSFAPQNKRGTLIFGSTS